MLSKMYMLRIRHAAGYLPELLAFHENEKAHFTQLNDAEREEYETILSDIEKWTQIDAKFGTGSSINLRNPVMMMMVENPGLFNIILAEHFGNAYSYRRLENAA